MAGQPPILIHATAVALPVEADWAGVLLCGPSGSGKSDLALRLIDEGARLVADDQCELHDDRGVLSVSAPARLAGSLEVRGLGIVPLPHLDDVQVSLVAELSPNRSVERLPVTRHSIVAGVEVAAIRLAPFEESATSKLRLAVRLAKSGQLGALDRLAAS